MPKLLCNASPVELKEDELDVRSLQGGTEVIDCDLAPLELLVPVNECVINIALLPTIHWQALLLFAFYEQDKYARGWAFKVCYQFNETHDDHLSTS